MDEALESQLLKIARALELPEGRAATPLGAGKCRGRDGTTMTNTTENVIDLVQQQMQKAHQPGESYTIEELVGGAERDRTVDLLNAIQALSQLSYSPTTRRVLRGERG